MGLWAGRGPEHLLQGGLLATLHRAHVASAGPRDSGATAGSAQTEPGRRGDHRVSVDRAGEVEKLPGQYRHGGRWGDHWDNINKTGFEVR